MMIRTFAMLALAATTAAAATGSKPGTEIKNPDTVNSASQLDAKTAQTLEKFTKAYNSLDLPTIKAISASALHSGYCNIFDRYRKNKLKPELKLKVLKSRKNSKGEVVFALATITENGKKVCRNSRAFFVFKDGIIQQDNIARIDAIVAAANNVGARKSIFPNKPDPLARPAKSAAEIKDLIARFVSDCANSDMEDLKQVTTAPYFRILQGELLASKDRRIDYSFIDVRQINSGIMSRLKGYISKRAANKWAYRNIPGMVMIYQDKISRFSANLQSPDMFNPWHYILTADAVGVVHAEGGKDERKFHLVKILCGDESNDSRDMEFKPGQKFSASVSSPGYYIVLLKKVDGGFTSKLEINPVLCDKEHLVELSEYFHKFYNLEPAREPKFIKQITLEPIIPDLLRATGLMRYMTIRHISKTNTPEEMTYLKGLIFSPSSGSLLKNAALAVAMDLVSLGTVNVGSKTLEYPQLYALTHSTFRKYASKKFSKLTLSQLSDPKKRDDALKNAAVLLPDPDLVSAAMKLFKPEDKAGLKLFMPLLTAEKNEAGNKFVENFMKKSTDSEIAEYAVAGIIYNDNLQLTGCLVEWLKKQEGKPEIYSPLALLAVSWLCDQGNPDGIRISRAALKKAADDETVRMYMLACFSNGAKRLVSLSELKKQLEKIYKRNSNRG